MIDRSNPWAPGSLLCRAAYFWRNEINTIDHVQVGWISSHLGDFDRRERRLLMLAALAPDADGIGMPFYWIAAFIKKLFFNTGTDGILHWIVSAKGWIYDLHHTFGHNLFYAVAIGALIASLAKRNRVRMFFLGALMVVLHLVTDILTAADPSWAIPFLWPLYKVKFNIPIILGIVESDLATWEFALTVVVQLTLKAILFACSVVIMVRHRRFILELFSAKLDGFLVNFAILPFQKKCDVEECNNRAHYRCDDCQSDRCVRHSKVNRDLTITCADCSTTAEST